MIAVQFGYVPILGEASNGPENSVLLPANFPISVRKLPWNSPLDLVTKLVYSPIYSGNSHCWNRLLLPVNSACSLRDGLLFEAGWPATQAAALPSPALCRARRRRAAA